MGSVIAPIVGAGVAEDQMDAANRARQSALEQWTGLNAPDLTSQELAFQDFHNTGDLQNQAENAIGLGPSAMGDISTDPRLAQAQMSALEQLSQTGQMGMTPAEQAALNDAHRQAAAMAQAKTAQIQDQMARQGMGGSGASLAAQLQAAQSGADRANQNSNQIAQQAQQQALQAISQAGALGGQMQGQQFNQKAEQAKARDYINQFNAQNQQSVQSRNVASANAANARNVAAAQALANQNTQLANQQQQYNKGLIQQQFNNQAALAAGRSGQYAGIAQQAQQNAANTQNMYAGIGQGIDTAAGAAYKYSQSKPSGGGGNSNTYSMDSYGVDTNDASEAEDVASVFV